MTSASAIPLLVPTKLALPRLHNGMIRRERLLDRLRAAPMVRLTLLVAPAGFGKSTLVAQWLLSEDQPATGGASPASRFVWLTLDEHDRESMGFLAYLVGAIERVAPGALGHTAPLLRATDAPAPAIVLQALLVDLNAYREPLIIVLDEYHLVAADAIHHTVAYLLRHLPEQCRLVVLTRNDPPLPLVRLRVEQQVLELRAADLRFTPDEAGALLTRLHGGAPDPELVADLYRQTEGWPLALQLAALVQPDGMTHSPLRVAHRQITEYLIEEIFTRQSDEMQAALVVFAVPDRFCAGLAAALLDQPDDETYAEALIDRIVRANLLLTPLEGEGGWYRFHPLFRDLLLRHLRLTYERGQLQALQRRAAQWLDAAQLYAEAIRLYLAADAADPAGALVERILHRELGRDIATAPPTYWLNQLPAELIERRPGLALIAARIAAFRMDVAGALAHLELVDALRARQAGAPPPWPTFEADRAVVRGTVLYYAQRAPESVIDVLHDGLRLGAVPSLAASALAFLARAYAAAGRYDEGVRLLTDLPATVPELTGPMMPLVRHTALCMVHEFGGRINDFAQEAQLFTATLAALNPPGAWPLFAAAFRARAAYERSELHAAASDFAHIRARPYETNAHTSIGCLLGLGQIALARGALADAETYAQEAWAFADEMGGAFLRNEALGFTVRLALMRNDLPAALAAAEQITPEAHPGTRAWYAIAPPQLSQAAAWIAAGDAASLARADAAITQVLAAVEPVRNVRPLIAALVMQARLMHARGRTPEALLLLERVLLRAATLGLVRTILDCGPEVQPLLQQVRDRGVVPAYLNQLLDGFLVASAPPPPVSIVPITPVGPVLPEALTRRELEITTLLAERWTDKEIAERLVITANTVRKHTSTIYSKLGVSSRREAVEVARSLGLLR